MLSTQKGNRDYHGLFQGGTQPSAYFGLTTQRSGRGRQCVREGARLLTQPGFVFIWSVPFCAKAPCNQCYVRVCGRALFVLLAARIGAATCLICVVACLSCRGALSTPGCYNSVRGVVLVLLLLMLFRSLGKRVLWSLRQQQLFSSHPYFAPGGESQGLSGLSSKGGIYRD